MAWVTINTARNAMDAPISQDWGNDVVNNLNYLFSLSSNVTDAGGAPVIPNGSFELDPNNSVTATSWTVFLGTGATGVVTNTDQNHGANSFLFTRDSTPGHSGGSLTSDYFNVSPSDSYIVQAMLKCSAADVENTIQIAWFTSTKTPISTITLYDSGVGSNAPTIWTALSSNAATPPATAVFAQIILNAGLAAQTPIATRSIFWDGVCVFPRQPFSDSITYTSANTFTVPSGCFVIRVVCRGKRANSNANLGYFGGHIEYNARVKPGDTMAVSFPSTTGASAVIPNGPTITANGASSSADGTTTNNGQVNLTGASTLPAPAVSVYY